MFQAVGNHTQSKGLDLCFGLLLSLSVCENLMGVRPNESRISCGLRRPQIRQIRSLSSGRRGPTASCAG